MKPNNNLSEFLLEASKMRDSLHKIMQEDLQPASSEEGLDPARRNQNLTKHLEEHRQETPKYRIFKCDICPGGYTTKRSLKRHQRKHSNKM